MTDYFNAKTETSTIENNFSPLAAGTYEMYVDEIEERDDKYGNAYIKCVLAVTEGKNKGRKHFENLYLAHPEWEGTVTRSRAVLKTICESAKVEALRGPADLRKLIGAEITVQFGVYKDKNIINEVKAKKDDDVPF